MHSNVEALLCCVQRGSFDLGDSVAARRNVGRGLQAARLVRPLVDAKLAASLLQRRLADAELLRRLEQRHVEVLCQHVLIEHYWVVRVALKLAHFAPRENLSCALASAAFSVFRGRSSGCTELRGLRVRRRGRLRFSARRWGR